MFVVGLKYGDGNCGGAGELASDGGSWVGTSGSAGGSWETEVGPENLHHRVKQPRTFLKR